MDISAINKVSNLNILKKNNNIKTLELYNLTLDDDWSLISEVKDLEKLIIKDSYIDFIKFYKAICTLKKLKELQYNQYCYFNKKEDDKLSRNVALPSLKIFRLKFPDSSEPDFEINNWSQKSYENKFNSITDIPNSHLVFPNLEVIELVNYGTYIDRIKSDDSNNKKILKEIYWNMKFEELDRFKNLKNIFIDKGKASDLYLNGLENFLKIIEKRKSKFLLNGLNKKENIDLDLQTVNFFCGENDEKSKIFSKLDSEFLNNLKKNNIVLDEYYYNINEFEYYKDTYQYRKPFKIKKNKDYVEILKSKISCFIFKSCFKFLNTNNSGNDKEKKLDVLESIFKNQNYLKTIIFDLSLNKKYDSDYDLWGSEQITFLIKFIYELRKINPDVKIYIYHPEIEKMLNGSNSKDNFKLHLIYMFNAIKINNLEKNLEIVGAKNDQLEEFTSKYINENVNQVLIVDDIFYNCSKYFPDQTIIHRDLLESYKDHYPKYYNQSDKKWSKLNYQFKEVYTEVLRIISFYDIDFSPDPSSLIIVIKKSALNKIKNINLKKAYIYLGASLHHVTTEMNYTEKNWNAKKIVGILTNNNVDGIKKIKDKLYSVAEKVSERFISSEEFKESKLSKNDFLKPTDNYEIIDNLNIDYEKTKNLTHCWIEGVNPWQEKYINLSKLNDLISLENLEYLKLSDCIHYDDLNLPKLPKLKVLKLNFYQNHHKKSLDNVVLTSFENCPNLQKLDIRNLYNFYNKDLFKFTLGYTGYTTNLNYNDSWTYINVDLSKINILKKLEEINFSQILASDLSNMKTVENLKKINLKVFHFVKDDYLSQYDEQPEINDRDLSFFYGSKKLEEVDLYLGERPHNDYLSDGCYSSYKGSGEFLNKINHKIKKLTLNVNVGFNNQTIIQDIINKITNRFLSLEELKLTFGIAARSKYFNLETYAFNKKIDTQILDFKKFAKLKKLTTLEIQPNGDYCFIKFKIINFEEIINLKKIKTLDTIWSALSFSDLRKTRLLFKNEKYENPSYYDDEYNYYEDDSDEKKNWSRFLHINTDNYDWYSLESKYLDIEKEENKKKFEKRLVIKKNKSKTN